MELTNGHLLLAVTSSKLILAHVPSTTDNPDPNNHDVISETHLDQTLTSLNQSKSPIYISFASSSISIGTPPFELSEQDGEPVKCFSIPNLVGFVSLGSGSLLEDRVPHLTVVTKRKRVGNISKSTVFVVEQVIPINLIWINLQVLYELQVAVLPCNSAAATLSALSDALIQRNTTSLVNMSPIDSARFQSVATVKAGVGLGMDTVKAGVGLGVGTVKAGVGLGVGLVSSSVGLVSTIGSNTLSVLKTPLRSRTQSNSAQPPSGEDGEAVGGFEGDESADEKPDHAIAESPQPLKKQTTAATVSKMVSSFNPFKSKDTLQVVNNGDSSPEIGNVSDNEQTVSEHDTAGTITTTARAPSSESTSPGLSRPSSSTNLNVKGALMSSLSSLRSLGTPQPPITQESVQPSDIKSLLELQTFFYCDGSWDLTRRSEQQNDATAEKDERFFWNKAALKPLTDLSIPTEYITPMIQGFVQVKEKVSIREQTETELELEQPEKRREFDFAVVSRRSKYRAGFRYERRGVDSLGRVANFVETEMIVFGEVEGKQHIGSFLQIRGSIPLYWSQVASTKTLNPTPTLNKSDEENLAALVLHVEELERLYKSVVIVDLVGKEGREEPLGTKFKTSIKSIQGEHPQISYKDYDFHHETKGLHYENLKNLLEILDEDFEKMRHYWSIDGEQMCQQTGIIRTNCMDCLDRTNVVQSILARHMLNKILVRMGIQRDLPETPTEGGAPGLSRKQQPASGQPVNDFESLFKNVFANNGDCLSTAYTGTGALKGDFTRTGVRNVKGMLNDAANSVTRLYADNFQNKVRQAAVDLFLGV
ncbi:UNVERIFIED_CONTAM: Phosphatidylinositide phosphatase SAC2 [Siphonaria sp. JEL0065]|nr:Phosphatidylinositide phosphatase SAC2 [Siphonaria sp. JEL0065]